MPNNPPAPVTDVAILTALHDRLIAARTVVPNASPPSWNYPLSDVVLPGAGDGNPGAVQTTLVSALTPGASTPLTITAVGDPVLTVQANPARVTLLTLTGTSPALTSDPATAVSLVFTVSSALQLQATWRAVPSVTWTLASAFDVLAGTAFARLPLSGATFAATTFDHLDGSFYFPLRAGLQFQAFVAVRSDLMPATSQPDQSGTQIGGPVQITANGPPQFAWTGRVPLGPLTIARIGQDPLTLANGRPALSCTPSSAGTGTVNTLTITGQITLAGTPVTCVVDLPTTLPGQLSLAATGTVLSAADTTTALAGTGTGDVLTAALPTSVQSLAGVSVTSYGLLFSPAGDQPTTTTVTLVFGTDMWSPVAALPLAISGLTLTGTVVRSPQPGTGPLISSNAALGGQVPLGPPPAANQPDPRPSFPATVALLSGKPVLFDVTLDANFPIGGFLAQCLTGAAAAWPSGFIDVTFQPGTHIYYYAAADDPQQTLGTLNGTVRSNGFNVDALIRLTFVTDVSVHGLLTVLTDPATGDYTGVSAAITLDQMVDLAFIQFAGSASPGSGGLYTGGPLLAVQTGPQPVFKLSTGINFLGSAFLTADVAVSKGSDGGTVMAGHLTAAQPLVPFGTLGCDCTYTTHPGGDSEFAIGNWPEFALANIAVDIVNAIKALADTSADSACGTLADFVANNAFTGSFTVTPSVSLKRDATGINLAFALTGTYSLTLTLPGVSSPFVRPRPLPAFTVLIPVTTTWADLPGALAAGVANAATVFANDLLSDRTTIAMFLAMVVGQAATAVGLELVCDGLVDGSVPGAAGSAVGAIGSAGGPAASGALGAAGTAISGWLAGAGPGSGGPGPGGGSTVGTAYLRTLKYAPGSVTGTWDAAGGASGYTFELLRPDGTVLAEQNFGLTLTGSLAVDPGPLPAGAYQGQVRGTSGSQTGAWSNQLSLTRPAGPAVTLSYAEPDLVASWPDAGADSYVVRFFDPSGAQLGADVTVGTTVHQASVPLPDPLSGAYAAAVESIMTDQFPSAFGNRATLVVLSLGPPQIGAITRSESTPTWATRTSGGTLTISWTPGDFAAQGYELRVTMGQVTLASLPTTSIPTIVALTQPVAAGASLLVQVRARNTVALSPWASATFIAWDVPAPASAQLDDIAGALTASWAAVAVSGAPAAVYNLQLNQFLTVQSQPAVGSVYGAAGPPVTLSPDNRPQPAPGTQYSVGVQAEIGGNLGLWTTSAPVVIATITPPTGVTLTASGPSLSLSWAAPPAPPDLTGPLSYDVVLLEGTTQVGESVGVPGVTLSPARGDNQLPVPGQAYTAQVRAATAGHASGWAISPAVTIMDVPQVPQASYAAGMVTVRWTPSTVTGAEYDVDLLQDISGGAEIVTPVTGPPTTQIDMAGEPHGTYMVKVRARTANSTSAWSMPPTPVVVIDPPAGLVVRVTGTTVSAFWNPASGPISSYTLTLSQSGDTLAGQWTVGPQSLATSLPPPGLPLPPISFTLPASAFQLGVGYSLTVAASDTGGISAPSAPVSVPIITPPPLS